MKLLALFCFFALFFIVACEENKNLENKDAEIIDVSKTASKSIVGDPKALSKRGAYYNYGSNYGSGYGSGYGYGYGYGHGSYPYYGSYYDDDWYPYYGHGYGHSYGRGYGGSYGHGYGYGYPYGHYGYWW